MYALMSAGNVICIETLDRCTWAWSERLERKRAVIVNIGQDWKTLSSTRRLCGQSAIAQYCPFSPRPPATTCNVSTGRQLVPNVSVMS